MHTRSSILRHAFWGKCMIVCISINVGTQGMHLWANVWLFDISISIYMSAFSWWMEYVVPSRSSSLPALRSHFRVCVRERERERIFVCMWANMYRVYVRICVRMCMRTYVKHTCIYVQGSNGCKHKDKITAGGLHHWTCCGSTDMFSAFCQEQ
jgi:hypothetical protein